MTTRLDLDATVGTAQRIHQKGPRGRRAVLRAVGGVALTAVAGCLGGGGSASGSGADDPASAGGTPSSPTADPDSLAGHPAAAGLAGQPRLGPIPGDATATIVAFEDPSCTRCRAFEQNTVPRIEAELVEPGDAAFVFRGYPVVYPWGKPATQALESTYIRSADAFWALKDHYFAEQSAFREAGRDQVLERTRAFLSSETDLDADAVVADAESKVHDAAVQADIEAGRSAGATVTPSVFLFREGQFVTKAQGSVGFDVITNALGF